MNEDQNRRNRSIELAIEIAKCSQPSETIEVALKQIMEAARQLDAYMLARPDKESK